MVWYIRVTARNGGMHSKKPQNGVFRYLDTPPTLSAKSSIKELSDLVDFFYLYSEADPYVFNEKIFRLKVMCFRIYRGSKIEYFQYFFA